MYKCIYPHEFVSEHHQPGVTTVQYPTIHDIMKQETAEYGVGIMAMRHFGRGESLRFIAQQTPHLLQHSLQRNPGDNLYDPYFIGFLLHSCNPNVVLDMHQQRVFFIRDIAQGEPLCMDYASTEDVLYSQFPCGCHAPNCRGWIAGRSEPLSLAGQQHMASHNGHHNPLTPTSMPPLLTNGHNAHDVEGFPASI